MSKEEKMLFPLDLQFFAEGAEDDEEEEEETTEEEETEEGSDDEETSDEEEKEEDKVTIGGSTMSKEQAMKLLGIEDASILDTVIAVQNATKKQSTNTDDAEERVIRAELKADLLQQEVKSNFVEDAIAIVQSKMKSGTSQKDAITLLKKNHASMFKVDGVDEGTGRSAGTARKSTKKKTGVGERLAKLATVTKPKTSYFE